MSNTVRLMRSEDKNEVIAMMRVFYASPAVHTSGSSEIFEADFEACIGESPYLEGYIFESDGVIQGYAMLAKSFSTEFGKPCIWIEDLYVKENFRGLGIGGSFLSYVKERYEDSILRLEVEEENKPAVKLYKKCGFEELPYMEMKK